MNTWGNNITLSIFGESHGAAVGMTVGGLEPGLEIDWNAVRAEMDRRAPGRSDISTPRREDDGWEILSGVFNGRITGAPLCFIIRNENTRSGDYHPEIIRPGHADLTAHYKYRGFADYRGGGHFSGRLTAPLVLAGAIAKQYLAKRGITVGARIKSIYNINDVEITDYTAGSRGIGEILSASRKSFPVIDSTAGERMRAAILAAAAEGDSVGGVIECAAAGIPAGLGNPFFGSLESSISSMMFSIPAVKGIEFGGGFDFAGMRGSEANDQLYYEGDEIRARSNHNGGINGGISNGFPLVFRAAVKPTPTISRSQGSVDINKRKNVTVNLGGRHDPCIVPRAVPVVEAGLALCLLDEMKNY